MLQILVIANLSSVLNDMEKPALPLKSRRSIVKATWKAIECISQVHITAISKKGIAGWNGTGAGEIGVVKHESSITFHESGNWVTENGHTLPFKNVFHWTLSESGETIQLAHLRFGPQKPVFLFTLIPIAEKKLIPLNPHLCIDDCYDGQVDLIDNGFDFSWKIIGPKKDELIQYRYR